MTSVPPVRSPDFVATEYASPEDLSTPGRAVRLVREKALLVMGITLLAIFAGLAIFGPFFVADPLKTDPSAAFLSPSADHWFGTDNFGRDVFARSVHAARLDLTIGLIIAALALLIGSAIGVVSGYFGGRADELMMRFTDILLAFPGFVLALVIVAALEDSTMNVIIAVSVSYVPYFIRLTRGQVLIERELEYVDGARLAGSNSWRVAFRHVLPNAFGPSMVGATLVTGYAILTVAGLAFLSVGIQPPTAEWGVMVGEGANDIITGEWWTSLFPGAMIVVAIMAFHFIGDELGGDAIL
jgi:peptide/nickel transport system permease protein